MALADSVSAAKEEIAVKIADLQSSINSKLDGMALEADAEKIAFGAEQFKAGQDSIILPPVGTGELIYTQENMDALAAQVRSEKDAEYAPQLSAMSAQLAEMQAALSGLQAEMEILKGDVAGQVAEGVKLGKAAVVAKVRAFKAAGDSAEDALLAELEA